MLGLKWIQGAPGTLIEAHLITNAGRGWGPRGITTAWLTHILRRQFSVDGTEIIIDTFVAVTSLCEMFTILTHTTTSAEVFCRVLVLSRVIDTGVRVAIAFTGFTRVGVKRGASPERFVVVQRTATLTLKQDINKHPGLILGLCPANERRRYFVITSLIGWVHLRGLWGLAPSNLSILRKIDTSKSQWSPVV